MRSDLLSRPRPLRPQQQSRTHNPVPGGGAAAVVAPLLDHFFRGPPPVRFEFWDGTSLGPSHGDTLQVRSPDAVQRLLWAPGELGLARPQARRTRRRDSLPRGCSATVTSPSPGA